MELFRRLYTPYVLSLLFLTFCVSGTAFALEGAEISRKELVLLSGLREGSSLYNRFQAAYSYLFDKIGYDVRLRSIPSARSLLMIKSDLVDGEFGRIKEYGELMPNMVRVDVPITLVRYGMFTNQSRFKNIHTMEDLAAWDEGKLTIGYIRGVLGLEVALEECGLDSIHKLYATNDSTQSFKMLKERRLDIALGFVSDASGLRKPVNDGKDGIRFMGVFSEQDAFIFLKRKHVNLVPLLEQAIRETKADGSLDRLLSD